MFNHLRKKIVSLMLFVLLATQSASAIEAHSPNKDNNLTNTQLHAVMGIITNFILSSGSEVELNTNPYLEEIEIPEYDSTDSSHLLITPANNNISFINEPSIQHFYLAPGQYDDITLTASGTENAKRTISLYEETNQHPASLPNNKQANIRIYFENASYWVLDRISDLNNNRGYLMRLEHNSSYNIINRYHAKNYYNGVRFQTNSHYNTIQNSYIDTSTHIGRLGDSVAIAIYTNEEDAHVYGTKIINNDIRNAGDGFQAVKNGDTHNVSADGTIVDSNNIWTDQEIYTDGNYSRDGYSNDPNSLYKVGEDGMDLKMGSNETNNPMVITNNRIWGYRRGDPTALGSQTIGTGYTMMVHYDVRNVLFKNNVVFDSDSAMYMGDRGSDERIARNWSIENNIFYDIGNKSPKEGIYTFLIASSIGMKTNNNSFINFTSITPDIYESIRLVVYDGEFNNNTLVNTYDLKYTSNNPIVADGNYYYNAKERMPGDTNGMERNIDELVAEDYSFTYARFTTTPKEKTLENVIIQNTQ